MGSSSWYFVSLLLLAYIVAVVHGQSGFISIDCGKPESYSYNDAVTGLPYTSDSRYIETGENHNISQQLLTSDLPSQAQDLRSFPEGNKNCYTLTPVNQGNLYLVRAFFLYGNYDGLNSLPQFDLYLGINPWETITLSSASHYSNTEILAVAPADTLSVCLLKTGSGTPFISALELRPLPNSVYVEVNATQSLVKVHRLDFGATYSDSLRYKSDAYDRIWTPYNLPGWKTLTATSPLGAINSYEPPLDVMKTAVTPITGSSLNFSLTLDTNVEDPRYYNFRHFVEVQSYATNESRTMNIFENDEEVYSNLTLRKHDYNTIYTVRPVSYSSGKIDVSIREADNSTLPPIINAMEVYLFKPLTEIATNSGDVDAITDIKVLYRIQKNWMGDPCTPQDFNWDGLNCSYNYSQPPRIISLNLSSSGLTGGIPASIAQLTELRSLDLSRNNFTGGIPNFLASLLQLTLLNLSGNRLSGPVPKALADEVAAGRLTLSIDGNPLPTPPTKKSKKLVIVVAASVCSAMVLLLVGLVVIWILARKRPPNPKPKSSEINDQPGIPTEAGGSSFSLEESRKFTYHELEKITASFKTTIGRGAFGTVYYGVLENKNPVAVKMLQELSAQGQKQFHAEAQLLTKVHHKNLVSLVGYCNDKDHLTLVYEYMGQGSLADHLSGRASKMGALRWRERLRIGVEAAQGLEYLHNGCKPSIIHRDIKTSNILLSNTLEVRIGDFGLSRIFDNDANTGVMTAVMGTPGYLDPEYSYTNMLTEKSDVYSYGVVLLELITGKPAMFKQPAEKRVLLVEWARPMLAKGQLSDIVDPKLQGDYSPNSIWKAIDVAMRCTMPTSMQRPDMIEVLTMLKSSLGLEKAHRDQTSLGTSSGTITESFSMPMSSIIEPEVR